MTVSRSSIDQRATKVDSSLLDADSGDRSHLRAPEVSVPPSVSSFASKSRRLRRGMTLTEMLIAITVTLVLLAAMVNAFRVLSDEITDSRAILDVAGQLRSTCETIRSDLRGLTVPVQPWVDPADGLGYYEQCEYSVVSHDSDFTTTPDNLIGDLDDVLMFTARSTGKPFRGRVQTLGGGFQTIESPVAEIAIWTLLHDNNGDGLLDRSIGEYVTVHRRVLLVRPDLNNDITIFPTNGQIAGNNDLLTWYRNNDVSVHVTNVGLVANSLGDLSKREYRFAHFIGYAPTDTIVDVQPTAFPYPISRSWLNALVQNGNFRGEDVLMSDVVEFDIKVFDPTAPVYDDRLFHGGIASVALIPGDPAYPTMIATDIGNLGNGFAQLDVDSLSSRGAYVDLGYLVPLSAPLPALEASTLRNASQFSGQAMLKSQMNVAAMTFPEFSSFVYDTWPSHYEADGLNQDQQIMTAFASTQDVDAGGAPSSLFVDEGIDGVDNPNDDPTLGPVGSQLFGPDDASERETSPPYLNPLRGIEITIRVVEPRSQQSRQSSLAVDFVGL